MWLAELDKREKYFGDQANDKHSDALKRNNAANEGFTPDSNPKFPDRKQLGFLAVEAAQASRADLVALGILNPSETIRNAAIKAAEARLLESKVNSSGNDTLRAEIQGKYSAKPEVRAETEEEAADREAFDFLEKEHVDIQRRTFDAGLRKWATYSRSSSEVQSHSKEAQAQLIACAKLKEQAVDMTEDSRETLPVAILDQFEEVGGTLMEGVVSNIKDNKSGGLMSEMSKLSTKLQREVKGENSHQVSYDYFDALSPQFVGAVALDALFTLHNIPEGKQRVACTLAFIAGFSASYEGFAAQRAISDWLTGVAPIDPPLEEKEKVTTTGSSPLVTRRYARAENPTGEQQSLGLFWRTKLSHDFSFGRASSSVLSQYHMLKTDDKRQTDAVEIAALEKSNAAMFAAADAAYNAAKVVVMEVNDKLFAETTKRGLNGTYAAAMVNLGPPSLEYSR